MAGSCLNCGKADDDGKPGCMFLKLYIKMCECVDGDLGVEDAYMKELESITCPFWVKGDTK